MTPLAYKIVKELTLPAKRRSFIDSHHVLDSMRDIHCFEMSDVWDLALEMGQHLHDKSIVDGKYQRAVVDETVTFLPAPRTWIEFTGSSSKQRVGILLIEVDGLALCTQCVADHRYFGSVCEFVLPLAGFEDFGALRLDAKSPVSKSRQITNIFSTYAALAFINTPRIIGRRQHMPHRGLKRDLARATRPVGKFPLHAWTEIKLEVTAPPIDLTDESSVEAHLAGQRALHFCRAHVRIRLGKLEIVRAHWRGDPALCIKQSRYKITP